MSKIQSSAEHLTLNADGSGNDIKFQSNGSEVASISDGGVVTATTFTGAATDATKLPLAGGTITGNIVGGDNIKLQLGDNNGSPCLEIFHDNSNSYVKDVGPGSLILNTDGNNIQITSGSSEVMAQFNKDGASDLYHNGTKRLFTLDNGSETNGSHTAHNFNLPDNGKVNFGAGNDLQIYHDGTHSYFKNSHASGSTRFNQKYFEVNNTAGNESMLSAYEDGAVTLRYDGSEKIKTTSAGLEVQGKIEINSGFEFTAESGSTRMSIAHNTGNVWIDGNCSAASFTDRTPYPETLQLAYDVINSHKKLPDGQYKADDESKQLDHSQLHEYVSLTTPSILWTENDNLPEGVSVGDVKKEEEKSRNMSGVMSCLVEVIKDLSTKNAALEARITALEA